MPPLGTTLLQDDSHLSASAVFKITGLNALFDDGPEQRGGKNKQTFILPQFGPGLSFPVKLVSEYLPDQDGPGPHERQKALFVYIGILEDKSKLPMTINASVEVLSFSAQTIFGERSFQRTYTKDSEHGHGWRLLTRDFWEKNDSMKLDDGILLRLRIQSPPGPNVSSSAVATVLHKVICDSGVGGFDIRFTVFDQRHLYGRLGARRSLLADDKVIQDSCKALYQGIFSADDKDRWNGIRVEVPEKNDSTTPYTATYIDPDSDFEEDEDDDPDDDSYSDLSSTDDSSLDEPVAKRAKLELSDPNEDSERTAVNVIEDLQPTIQSIENNQDAADLRDTEQTDNNSADETDADDDDKLDVVVIGASSVTWEALLFYLHTGIIEFAPLVSSGSQERDAYIRNYCTLHPRRPQPCSPKSMYRIAQELGLTSLQHLCLTTIKGQLTNTNVIPEIFTSFTAKHEDIKRAEMAYLVQHWKELKDSAAFREATEKLVSGTYPHAGGLLREIFQAVEDSVANP